MDVTELVTSVFKGARIENFEDLRKKMGKNRHIALNIS